MVPGRERIDEQPRSLILQRQFHNPASRPSGNSINSSFGGNSVRSCDAFTGPSGALTTATREPRSERITSFYNGPRTGSMNRARPARAAQPDPRHRPRGRQVARVRAGPCRRRGPRPTAAPTAHLRQGSRPSRPGAACALTARPPRSTPATCITPPPSGQVATAERRTPNA